MEKMPLTEEQKKKLDEALDEQQDAIVDTLGEELDYVLDQAILEGEEDKWDRDSATDYLLKQLKEKII